MRFSDQNQATGFKNWTKLKRLELRSETGLAAVPSRCQNFVLAAG